MMLSYASRKYSNQCIEEALSAVAVIVALTMPSHACCQVEKGTQGVDGRVVNPKSKGKLLESNTISIQGSSN
jgi:hypothetical protein